jgi:pyruvate dehydrogenase E2 component (dihydrolipoamide acetyltransferase)
MKVLSEITIPKDDADEEVIIIELNYKDNDQVKKSDSIMDIETSKTSIELEAPTDGYIEYLVNPGDEVVIGQVVAKIYDGDISDLVNSKVESSTQEAAKENQLSSKVATKEAQALIEEHGIDINLIPNDFIKKEDVDLFIKGSASSGNSDDKPSGTAISRSKKIEIKALSGVQSTGMVSTIFMNIDVDESLSDDEKTSSYLPLITSECAKALEVFPMMNSYFLDNHIIQHKLINIGLALDINNGLKVYTIPDTNKLNLDEVEGKINEGIYKYLRNELTPRDLSTSTFTISDLSQYGVEKFVPLINLKQAAILGVSAVDLKLNRFNLSLAFDHRVTEGRVASEFLSMLKKGIEVSILKN